jgi:hypothetical protein
MKNAALLKRHFFAQLSYNQRSPFAMRMPGFSDKRPRSPIERLNVQLLLSLSQCWLQLHGPL